MSNAVFTGARLGILLSALVWAETPALCQPSWDGNPYDASLSLHSVAPTPYYLTWDSPPVMPTPRPSAVAGTVPADTLRNPLSSKAMRALRKAMHHAELGDHTAAIQRLREALVQYPQAAPYTLTLLGAEFMEMHRHLDAMDAFGQVARIMPHHSASHSNFGLSLALMGNLDVAERELRQALALDRGNGKARHILEAVLVSQRRVSPQTNAGLTPLP